MKLRIEDSDSCLKARLKLVYLIPSAVMLTLVLGPVALWSDETWPQLKAAWRHLPQ